MSGPGPGLLGPGVGRHCGPGGAEVYLHPSSEQELCLLPLAIPITSPLLLNAHPITMTTHPMMRTTGEMAEPRDMTLALHRVVVLGAHPVEASFSPPPCPPPRAGKAGGAQTAPRISATEQPSQSPAWGCLATSPQHPKFCQTVLGTNQDGPSTETCRTGECHWGMTTSLQRPPKGPGGCRNKRRKLEVVVPSG